MITKIITIYHHWNRFSGRTYVSVAVPGCNIHVLLYTSKSSGTSTPHSCNNLRIALTRDSAPLLGSFIKLPVNLWRGCFLCDTEDMRWYNHADYHIHRNLSETFHLYLPDMPLTLPYRVGHLYQNDRYYTDRASITPHLLRVSSAPLYRSGVPMSRNSSAS